MRYKKIFDLTEEKIQEYIKTFISSDFLKQQLEKLITGKTIEDFENLFNNRELTNKKYCFDLILFLVLRETVSIKEIFDFLNDEENSVELLTKVLEAFVILELDLYYLTNSEPLKIKNSFLSDNKKKIYYGNKDFISYKNEENLKEEMERILELSTTEKELLDRAFFSEVTTEKNYYKIFIQINEDDSLIEKNIGFSNFIFNYEDKKISLLNNILENGKYFLKGKDKVLFSSEYLNLKNKFYFKKLFNNETFLFSNEELLNLKTIFIKSLKMISERTINY